MMRRVVRTLGSLIPIRDVVYRRFNPSFADGR